MDRIIGIGKATLMLAALLPVATVFLITVSLEKLFGLLAQLAENAIDYIINLIEI